MLTPINKKYSTWYHQAWLRPYLVLIFFFFPFYALAVSVVKGAEEIVVRFKNMLQGLPNSLKLAFSKWEYYEEKENDIADIKKKFKTKQRTLFGQETIGKHFDGWFELCRAIKSLAEWDAEVKGDELAISMWQRTTFFDYYELYLEVHR